MKKIFIILLLAYPLLSFSQWMSLNTGTTSGFWKVHFTNIYTGWATGGISDTIKKTTNCGLTWTTCRVGPGNFIYSLHFTDTLTGWAIGGTGGPMDGSIYKTTNGGVNWFIQKTISQNFNCIFFFNNSTGWALAYYDIYYTSNGGTNWNLQVNPTLNALNSIYFPNAATGWIAGDNGYILKTTNSGANWISQSISTFDMFNTVYMLNTSTGWIGSSNNYILRTTNSGVNWVSQIVPASGIQSISFYSATSGIAVGGSGEIIKSTNAGINWSIDTTFTSAILRSLSIPNPKSAYVSGDGGKIFRNTFVKANLSNYFKSAGRVPASSITLSDSLCRGPIDSVYWYVNGVLAGTQHSMTYNYKQGTSLVKLKVSNNLGQVDSTTAKITVGVYKKSTTGSIQAGYSSIGDSVFFAVSTGQAVHRLDINGNTIYTFTANNDVRSACSIAWDTSVYFTTYTNNLYAFNKNLGPIWAQPYALGGPATCTPTIDSISNRLYVGVQNNSFHAINRLTGTNAWSLGLDAQVRNSAVVSYNRKLVCVTAVGTIYGFNLANLPSPIGATWITFLNDSVLVSPAIDEQGYFYIGSRSGKIYKVNLPIGSPNGTIVWQTPSVGSPVTSSLTIDGSGNLYFGTADGKLYSVKISSGAVTWNFQTAAQIRSTAAISSNGTIYFGNDNGEMYGIDSNRYIKFYFSDSSKVSCPILYNKGTIYFGNEAGRLFALYDTTGGLIGPVKPIWGTFQNNPRRTGNQKDGGTSIGVQKISENIPDKFELFQNYPNPFNPSTNIKYQIGNSENGKWKTENCFVTLRVYDILGRVVATLVNEKQSPGVYSIDFDGTMLASGVYFYKIQAGTFSELKKMILLK